jgi:altronate dehydratase large subunit
VTETLISLGKSPNLGAVLLVSLGCEGTDTDRLLQEIRASGKPVEVIRIQELGGTSKAIAAGMDAAQRLVLEISGQQRVSCDLSEVVMAIKCGGSDATSGMASNCVIGYVADKIVDLGGTVVFGETTEFIGAEHILAKRATDETVAEDIFRIVGETERRAESMGCDMRKGQPTPGNIAGGLTTIEEKSLGAIMKSGTRPIRGVLAYPESAAGRKGLWIKDSPGREPEILTGMAATGAQCMLFSTGRGAPQGFPSMPVIKICGNPHTYERMANDMDVNAGTVILGEKPVRDVGEAVFALMLEVLNGRQTKNETLGYFGSIDIHTLGPVI